MPQLTDVEFQFYHPDGTPLADTVFSITLRRPGFVAEATGVAVPDGYNVTTDATGKAVFPLHPSSTPYFLQLPADATVDEDCCSNALVRYKFYVPEVPTGTVVRAQDLFMAVAPSSVPYDEEAILIITEAKLASVAAAADAKKSADSAHTSDVQSYQNSLASKGSADQSKASADAAKVSQNAASGSASTAATLAEQARVSAVNSGNSANAASQSATAAANSANTAGTAGAAAGKAAAEAVVADKQPLNSKLNSLANATGTAAGIMPYLRTPAATAYSFLEMVTDNYDATPARVMTTGYGGIGANNNATYFPGTQNPDSFVVGALSYWATWLVAGVSDSITGFLQVQAGESGNLTQTIISRTMANTYTRTRNAGVWSAWRTSLMAGDNGIGIALFNRSLTPDASIASTYKDSGAAFAYSTAGPNNGNDAAYSTYNVNGAYATQILHDMNFNELYTRVKFGNSIGPWVKQISTANAVGDVTIANGGIMSYAIISGWAVTRYRNGVVVMISTFQSVGAQWAAGELRIVDVALPAAFVNTKPYIASASCVPGSVYDFQVHTAWLPSVGNIIRFALRNGATAQTFNASLRVEGSWL